jgi:hypothetical protein
MKIQDALGPGLIVVGIILSNSNRIVGTLFMGFGLGYSLHPHMQKMFKKK